MLSLAALVWIGIHLGISGTGVRDVAVARLGENGFRAAFSLLSVVAIVLLVMAWRNSYALVYWLTPEWLRWLLAALMLPAFMLFVGSVSVPNPTLVGPNRPAAAPRGMIRVTRHPMLWSFAIWAAVHIIGTGDSASIKFFGAFLITALAGMPSIDAKYARRDPATWAALSAATSIVPFAAIIQGRNQLVLREIGWVPPLIALTLWAVMIVIHPILFGIDIL